MKFTLEIELGNEAMQTGDEVCAAIISAMRNVQQGPLLQGERSSIRDLNGNTVGELEVVS